MQAPIYSLGLLLTFLSVSSNNSGNFQALSVCLNTDVACNRNIIKQRFVCPSRTSNPIEGVNSQNVRGSWPDNTVCCVSDDRKPEADAVALGDQVDTCGVQVKQRCLNYGSRTCKYGLAERETNLRYTTEIWS